MPADSSLRLDAAVVLWCHAGLSSPQVMAFSPAGDTPWLDVALDGKPASPMAMLAVAYAQHPGIARAVSPVLTQGMPLLLGGILVPDGPVALAAALARQGLDTCLPHPAHAHAPDRPRL